MKLSPSLLAALAFLCAGGLSVAAGQTIARVVEDRSAQAVEARLEADGFGWTSVVADGLQVVLEGEAPSEADRFNAISSAAKVVDGARVIDDMRVSDAKPLDPPDFALEVLRNDSGVSLIGLVPADTDRDVMVEEVGEAADGQNVSDLLQVADYPVPEGWEAALDYAVNALEVLPRAKISVAPGRVSIEAISDSPEDQHHLESELARMAPDGLRLALSVSAPLPVIAPFTLRARIEDGKFAFDACSADSTAARDAILAAAAAAGAEGPLDCRLGLGAPTTDWGKAAAQGIAALHDLGAGTLTMSDADMTLVAPPTTDAALFDRVAAELDGSLPDVFALDARRPVPDAAPTPQGPPQFTASLGQDGKVRLQGRIEDERMGGLARAFAQARFGAQDVTVATRPGPEGLPPGWSMRVLAGIEALSRLADGNVTVTPEAIVVAGRTGNAAARDEIAARAIETLGPGADLEIEVAYVEALDPLAALPTPEECLAKITAVTDAAKITFEPGSATISAQGQPVIEAIAGILRSCPDLRLRISGYTDAQGREETNLDLSQSRAEAVLAALRDQRVPVAGFQAQGFGEADPIASNDTEAGREANRRIEFSLVGAGAGPAAPAPGTLPDGRADSDAPAADGQGAPGEPEAAQPMQEAPDAPPPRPDSVEDEAAAQQPEADAPKAEADGATPPAGGNAATDAPSDATAPPDEGPAAQGPATPAEPAEAAGATPTEGAEPTLVEPTAPAAPAEDPKADEAPAASEPAVATPPPAGPAAHSTGTAPPREGKPAEGVAPAAPASDETERAAPATGGNGAGPTTSDGKGTAQP